MQRWRKEGKRKEERRRRKETSSSSSFVALPLCSSGFLFPAQEMGAECPKRAVLALYNTIHGTSLIEFS